MQLRIIRKRLGRMLGNGSPKHGGPRDTENNLECRVLNYLGASLDTHHKLDGSLNISDTSQ